MQQKLGLWLLAGWGWQMSVLPLAAQPPSDPLIVPRQPSLTAQRGLTVVIRSDAGNWGQIARTLPLSGVQVFPLAQLDQNLLDAARTIFLPNMENISEVQVQLLEGWVNRGGRLIVAGAIAPNASFSFKARLHRLLGGTWTGNLETESRLFVRSGEVYNWSQAVPNISDTIVSNGGKLQPASDSRVIAFWAGNSAAILARSNVYYLGWQWGVNPQQQAFDRSWLLALINAPSNTNIAIPPASPSPDSRPLSNVELVAMRQELQDLMGRVESAILLAGANRINSNAESALNQARQVLRDLPQMVANGQHREARLAWEQARQSLWQNYPIDMLSAKSEVRAIWLDRGTIVSAGSEAGLAKIFDRMANAGVNTVFIETINAGYPIYPSRVAPQQNPLIKGWDPLASAIRLARQRKMELHAWVWVFSVGNQRHNLAVGMPESFVGPVLQRYPQWANLNRNGSVYAPEGKMFLDPANPEVQDYLIRLYREIVANYDVDGLHIDYIRYPRQEANQDFGFSATARSRFMELTGVDPLAITPDNRSLWWMWVEFRTRQVNEFVARLAREMRRTKPKLIISAAVFPWHANERLNRLQQNWEAWVVRGDVDLLIPMTYVPDTAIFLRQRVLPALQAMGRSPVLFLPGVFIRNVEDLELLDQLQAVRDLPSGGFALFAAEHLRPSIETALKRTRIDENSKILPFRQPFTAARVRFASLQQEWQSVLQGESALVRGEALASWQGQAQQLAQTLEIISQSPSRERLQSAIRQVDNLSEDLRRWLRLGDTYRVNTWINRLQAIATILRFGEFRLLSGTLDIISER
jgi:uncharacterized lipoprotein YddW (UPF0748 family)